MKIRYQLIPLLSILIVGLLLAPASGAIAAPGDLPFTLGGVLSVAGDTYTIQGQPFTVNDATVCTDPSVQNPTCPGLNGKLVTVVGYISAVDSKHYATSIQAEPDTTVFEYTGELKSFSDTAWVLNLFEFKVGLATVIPPFYAVKDTVVATYTVEMATGDFLSKEFKVLNSGVDNTYTYSGTLTTINGSLWTVGEYTFNMENATLPPYFGPNDTVEVTFKIVDGDYVATSVKVVETFVGNKVYSNRCENRIKDQPAVIKLANEVKEDPKKIMDYFCLGFGVGEIKLAYQVAGNGYTPAMLLAMRADGMSWGKIKQLVANTPVIDTNDKPGSTVTSASHGNTTNKDKSNNGNGSDKVKSNKGKKP